MIQVVKIGSSCHFDEKGEFDRQLIKQRLDEIIAEEAKTVFWVSGAIALGKKSEGVTKNTGDLTPYERADYAAIGQHYLMKHYEEMLGPKVRQFLISPYDWEEGDNICEGMKYMLDKGRIIVCNTNDPNYYGEQTLDNDMPAVKCAIELEADIVYLLGRDSMKGFRGSDNSLYSVVHSITDQHYACCNNGSSNKGTGGMATKLNAASLAMRKGIDLIIGDIRDPFNDIKTGAVERTLFTPAKKKYDSH